MPYNALLVDDERLARKRLRTLLAEFHEVTVVSEAASATEALNAVRVHRPDVVFLDIQMPGESGFGFLQKTEQDFATIFVTAYDRFALRAFEVNGLDYLLKPVERDRLAEAIRRLSCRNAASSEPRQTMDRSDYVFVKGDLGGRFIPITKIQTIVAAGPYSEISTDNGNKWLMLRSIEEWQRRLPSNLFLRIHRSAIVNLECVDRVELLANYSYRVMLKGTKRELHMSRRRGQLLKKRFA